MARRALVLICLTMIWGGTQVVKAQNPAHDYPLIGWQTFSGAEYDFYARYDLLVCRVMDPEFPSRIRSMNPNIDIVWTYDWNSADSGKIPNFPDEWWLKDSEGNYLNSYGPLKMANMSTLCPTPASGPYAGMRYIDFVHTYYSDQINVTEWDGVGTDGVWGRDGLQWKIPRDWPDVDADGNGTNDIAQNGEEAFLKAWQAGIDIILNNIRTKLLSEGKYIIINSGTLHTWGFDVVNGVVDEKLRNYNDFLGPFLRQWYDGVKGATSQAGRRFISVANGKPDLNRPELRGIKMEDQRNDFTGMRFGLVTSMFNDVYFNFEDDNYISETNRTISNEHYWTYWYDEFETNLGKPTSGPRELKPGVWVRFFQRGCAIANVSGAQVVVNDAELRGLQGYAGPYFRFLGGQNPSFNDGSQFTSVTLYGNLYTDGPTWINGDGIILLDTKKIIVSDIVIDNDYLSTSPGSPSAILASGFVLRTDCKDGSDYYAIRCSWNDNTHPYALSAPGAGTATYRPTLGVAGNYEVYEWHGRTKSGLLASNARYMIKHANGEAAKTVDQNNNTGRWNSLGLYRFSSGSSGSVVISADGANNVVMADAIKFVFRGSGNSSDNSAPAPPGNVKVE